MFPCFHEVLDCDDNSSAIPIQWSIYAYTYASPPQKKEKWGAFNFKNIEHL